MCFPTVNLASLSLAKIQLERHFHVPYLQEILSTKQLRAGMCRVMRIGTYDRVNGSVPINKEVLVSECCGEGCGSILIPNVYALNRTRTKQAQIYIQNVTLISFE
ncbi:MAG: hypothetical protein ABSA44_04855 [Bacteroidota bacterium]|jgi:hypothetical protein